MNLFKSILHNIGVVIVGLGLAFIGTRVDSLFGISDFHSIFATTLAWLLLGIGFLVRVWATFYSYERRMKVISLAPQKTLITSGPYRFSRNPLYLGGNVFIFFGAMLLFGSPTGLFITAIISLSWTCSFGARKNNWRRTLASSGCAIKSRWADGFKI